MKKTKKQLLLSSMLAALLLSGCQSMQKPPDGLPDDIYTPAGPVVFAIKKDIEAGRLSMPAGNNAVEKLHRLALIDPNDSRTTQLSNEVAQRLITLGEQAYMKEEYRLAARLTKQALTVAPEYAKAVALLDAVQKAQHQESMTER